MRCRWQLWILIVGLAVGAATPGVAGARTSTTSSKSLGAGRTTVAPCGTITGLLPNFTISNNTVTAVLVVSLLLTAFFGYRIW